MRCESALRAVSAAADGDLDAAAHERLAAHLADCAACAAFQRSVTALRAQLRVEPVDTAPDVVTAVLHRITAPTAPPPSPRTLRRLLPTALRHRVATTEPAVAPPPPAPSRTLRRLLPTALRHRVATTEPAVAPPLPASPRTLRHRVADPAAVPPPPAPGRAPLRALPVAVAFFARVPATAAAAVGFLAGASYVGLGADGSAPAAADLPERIVALQDTVTALAADIEVAEHGRSDRAGTREFAGHLTYGGPEELQLSLREIPQSRARAVASSAPGDGDVQLDVTGDRWTLEAVRSCTPTQGRAACPGGATRTVRQVTGRAPFSEAAPIPLELVTPVDSFNLATSPPSLGERTVGGRPAIGVTLPASQVASFLRQLSPADDLRAVYSTDPVEMWLDRDSLVPLSLVVSAAVGPERQRWAAAEGYDDRPGEPILEFRASRVQVNEATAAERPPPDDRQPFGPLTSTAVSDHRRSDEGFDAGDTPSVPTPRALPAEFSPSRSGIVRSRGGPTVEIRSWTDGRAWLKIEATREWEAQHLFGGLGAAVRAVDLGPGGRGYLSTDGRKVAVHTDELDLVVTGSLPTGELVDVAGSLGLQGTRAPDGWREAGATTLTKAAGAVPGLLAPSSLDGFGHPAVRVAPDDTVTQVYAGPGDRGFVLTQSATAGLAPPTDDALGVEVRGVPGRYSVDQALLEWSEGESSFSIGSPTLPLTELLDIAAALTPR